MIRIRCLPNFPYFTPSHPQAPHGDNNNRVHQEARKMTRLLSTDTTRPPTFSTTISIRDHSYNRPPLLPLRLARQSDPPHGKMIMIIFPLTIGDDRDGVAYRRDHCR